MIDKEFKTDMDLIYIYIDKYRTFEKQECAFSNKFEVSYNAETKDLTITRNKDYFDIYPGNILGINAVLGKNASGKTSFMSLIGERIDDRKNRGEIYVRPEKPHEPLEILSKGDKMINAEEGKFVSKYFLVYYYGKDDKDEDLFILETCCPEEYTSIFENRDILLDREDKEVGRRIDYYIEKGWMSCVFKIDDNKNIWYNNTQNYKVDGFSPEMDSSIIFFKNSVKKDSFRFNDRDEEESIISVKRIESVMEDVSFFRRLIF